MLLLSGETIEIDWLAGFSDPSERAKTVKIGDVLKFTWAYMHNVYLMPSKEAFDNCEFAPENKLSDTSPYTYTYLSVKMGGGLWNHF